MVRDQREKRARDQQDQQTSPQAELKPAPFRLGFGHL
jgi:hypothetical protein